MTTSPQDDLEAVRIIVKALEGFAPNEQERIMRWAREKVGLTTIPALTTTSPTQSSNTESTFSESKGVDIKSFVDSKNPPNDVQFAASVAYYYRFEALAGSRKDSITSTDLQDACRMTVRKRLKNPGQTLRNAHKLGLLDKATESGYYVINSVGENLVAMTLPQKTKASVRSPKNKKSASGE